MDVTVIVATYGDLDWQARAYETAVPSAVDARPHRIIVTHNATLAKARNLGADLAATEWLLFLDADDELAPGYIEAMAGSDADLRAPRLHLIYEDSVEVPELASRDINRVNPCCIGTLIRKQMFHDVGGFWEEPAWEDWSLFRRCWLLGARIDHIDDAIYLAHQRPDGRNSTPPAGLHHRIIRSHEHWLTERATA